MFSPSPVDLSDECLKSCDRFADHYTIIRRIGKGSFAEIYLVQEDCKDEPKVLKRPKARFSLNDRLSRLFVHEAELWISLGISPNIVTAYDVRVIDGLVHLLIEYVDGSALSDHLPPAGMDLRKLLRTAMDIANGLSFAWRKYKVTHGDLHPGNLLITKDGSVKITDFGLAYSYLHLYDVIGAEMKGHGMPKPLLSANSRNPCYLSPEQISDWFLVDTRSDIYAFGVLLYHMATGQFPFKAVVRNGWEAISQWHLNGDLTSPDYLRKELPPEIAQVIVCCLKKEPKERYQDFESVWAELKKSNDKYGFTSSYQKHIDSLRHPIEEMTTKLGDILTPRLEMEGLALQEIGKHREALEKFNESLKLKPEEFSTWLNKGNSHFVLGEIDQALLSVEKACQIRPDDLDVMLKIGRCQQLMGRLEKAEASLDSFIQKAPREHKDLCNAYYWHGQIYTLYEHYAEADRDYRLALNLLGMDHHIPLERPVTDISELSSMLDQSKETLKEDGLLGWFLYNRSMLSFMNYIDSHIRDEPGNARFVRWKGSAYRLIGEAEKALQYLRRAHDMIPTDADTTLELAEVLTELKLLEEADRLISDALRHEPENPIARLMKARRLVEKGEQNTALAILEKMMVECPNDPSLLNNLGALLVEMNKDLDLADKYFVNAADIEPQSNTAIHNRITLYKRKNDHDFILKLCDMCLERDPNDVEALLDKAIIFGIRGNLKETEQCLLEARRIDPENENGAMLMEVINKFAKRLPRM